MLRNRKQKADSSSLTAEQESTVPLRGSYDDDEKAMSGQDQVAVRTQKSWKSGPGRLLMDLLYAINDIIPSLQIVSDASESDVRQLDPFKAYVAIPFDIQNPEHKQALKDFWEVCHSSTTLDWSGDKTHASEQWKKLGFQGIDPATDFRGGGAFSLHNLLYLANSQPQDFNRLIDEQASLPFAIAGINVTMMLLHLLQLTSAKTCFSTSHTSTSVTKLCRRNFIRMLLNDVARDDIPADDDTWNKRLSKAFGEAYCVAFLLLEKIWQREGANIMQFNSVLLKCKAEMEEKLRFATSLEELWES
ncbi:ELMO domain-containing protein B [Diplonema papillatum]|nr:ELMO domain-containing protein B [Diplonema papillatum]